jgi:signal transduction histidine kinase
MNLRRPGAWVWLFLFFTAVGLLNFGHFYLDDLARDWHGTAIRRLMEELTGTYSSFALLPLILFITHRVPLTRRTWPRALSANVLGWLAYTSAHTTLMALSRAVIAPVIGLGAYDYGNLLYRYPMEAAGDAVWYTLIAATSYLMLRLRAARASELRAAELQQQLAEAQLENLRLQLNPHFLFNTLNAVSAVMYEDVRKADAMLAKLSDFLRTVLAASGVANVPLDEELAVERQYVEIMTARLERRLDLRVTVAGGAAGAFVPFMLLQPLIENSIRHGMADRQSLALEIDARRREGQMVIEIRDDGCGFEPNPRAGTGPGTRAGCGTRAGSGMLAGTGIGLANVRSRLAHLYGEAASLSLEARDGGGTRAIVAFPFTSAAVPIASAAPA